MAETKRPLTRKDFDGDLPNDKATIPGGRRWNAKGILTNFNDQPIDETGALIFPDEASDEKDAQIADLRAQLAAALAAQSPSPDGQGYSFDALKSMCELRGIIVEASDTPATLVAALDKFSADNPNWDEDAAVKALAAAKAKATK